MQTNWFKFSKATAFMIVLIINFSERMATRWAHFRDKMYFVRNFCSKESVGVFSCGYDNMLP